MGLFIGRRDKRYATAQLVALAHPNEFGLECPATTENVSDSGMRLVTDRVWNAGDRVLLTFPKIGRRIHARVIYCELLKDKRFAIGLQLAEPREEKTH